MNYHNYEVDYFLLIEYVISIGYITTYEDIKPLAKVHVTFVIFKKQMTLRMTHA